MSKSDWNGFYIVLIAISFILLLVCGFMIYDGSNEKICWDYGWPESSRMGFSTYCFREINKTEYVCLLKDVVNDSCILEYK
jgi:hypothetical protein